MSVQTSLAVYAALLSTALALLALLKFLNERPRIKVEAQIMYNRVSETNSTEHGVPVQVKVGFDLSLREAEVEVRVSNSGSQGCQITDVFVETANNIQFIRPKDLPTILVTNTQCTLLVQPEVFAPKTLSEKGTLQDKSVKSIGVIDAVGKKHCISKNNLLALLDECRQLPLRAKVFRHRETGNLVTAFQARDAGRLIEKQKKSPLYCFLNRHKSRFDRALSRAKKRH